jgi:subtilisin family serine protease
MIRTWLGIAVALSRTFCVALSSAAWADPPGNGSSPNDPMLAEQWYLFSPSDERGSPGSINAIEAWRHIRPAKSIVVALLDSGVNYTHPDLAANIWKNERELPNGKDDDGNGYVDNLNGWDFDYADNSPIDRRSRKFPEQFDHGTVLASLMAAVPDNGIGTAGIGRNIKVMNLRVVGEPEVEGQTSAQWRRRSRRRSGMPSAMARGSSSAPWGRSIRPRSNGTSLEEAEEAGVLFVQAAGNQGRNIDTSEFLNYRRVSEFLSRYSNVLIVGGTARGGGLSPRMNFGKRVGIAAPCVDVVAPSWDGYERLKGPGTSFAAPIVAAVAATLLSQEPELTPAQVIARLREASVLAPGMKGVIGGGRLDMAKLFRQ